jgi:2-keto-4-pentenoate hydratase/2-oxohepta-3-ene-1,7-dioic acid hydratase in catechol pathway
MRIARVATETGPKFAIQDSGLWCFISNPFSTPVTPVGGSLEVGAARLLSPTVPNLILGMAHNGQPSDRRIPPQAFAKSAHTAASTGALVALDPDLGETVVEGELAIVIGRRSRHLSLANASDAVLGYTVANDVTIPAQNSLDNFWTQGKNGENFTPLGPWIETELDTRDLQIRLRINGGEVSRGSTSQLARGVDEILVYLTRYLELRPGDVVLCGCPGTSTSVRAGDRFDIEIDGIGVLSNEATLAPVESGHDLDF